MNIAQASIDLKLSAVQEQVGMAIMRMAMDNAKVHSSAFNRMTEVAGIAQEAPLAIQDPAMGTLIDITA